VTKARRLIDSNELDEAEQVVKDAVVALDRAAQKGAIHRKNAARRKSRLARRLNTARDQ
jgi:small subunit ribosomal protein S20